MMEKVNKRLKGGEGKAGTISAGERQLSTLLEGGVAARKALTQMRASSALMPAGVPFFDELLAAGVKAACKQGAELEALDVLYFAGAGRIACVQALLAAEAPVERITCEEWIDCGVGGGWASFNAIDPDEKGNYGPWSNAWKVCARAMAQVCPVKRLPRGGVPLMHRLVGREGSDHLEFAASLGVDVNERDEKGMTSLMIAAESANEDVISRLLTLGANVFEKNKSGQDARGTALERDKRITPRLRPWATAAFDKALSKWERGEIARNSWAERVGPGSSRL